MATSSSKVAADRLKDVKQCVTIEIFNAALGKKLVNLGAGFQDFLLPDFLTKALVDAVTDKNPFLQQYSRTLGHPRLVNALSKFYSKQLGRELHPMKEILVTAGGREALFSSIISLVNPGDEVIIMEPFYPDYQYLVKIANGVPVFITLKPKKLEGTLSSADWILDPNELASKFTDKTKIIIVNTPHNPLGKVFTRSELQMISELCKKHNVICLMDEVYEHIVFSGSEHVRMATLPGMWERTITIGSASKTFGATGWRLGWAYGPQELLQSVQQTHICCVGGCCTPIQEAVAVGFEIEMERMGTSCSFWKGLVESLESKRNRLAQLLTSIGVTPTVPQGSYFMIVDFSNLILKLNFDGIQESKDYKLVKWLASEKKLQGLPFSAYFSEEHEALGGNFIRFCFIKDENTLEKATQIILDLKKYLTS
ncbi:kynurenine--oxoglutarate transaminase 3-like [Limulus polyphemus]|uniref:kynurenine--oxoglutarate transaminase n=1 Tax=Limulus polyphemus TaxID=6850 RepID=A0ABM1BP35_LIMPO|nr:kynurenine--oxoglutarate transaminase 3-like [Limulus polyphemus]